MPFRLLVCVVLAWLIINKIKIKLAVQRVDAEKKEGRDGAEKR